MSWSHVFDPLGNRVLSTAVSALPVLTLFFVLVTLKKHVWGSALSGLVRRGHAGAVRLRYQRIVGELKGLGIVVSATTVKKILREEQLGPAGKRKGCAC